MPEAQLDDLALIRLQLGENGLGQPLPFGLLWVDFLGRPVSLVRRMVGQMYGVRRVSVSSGARRPGGEPALAFVAGHRKQPRAQLGGLGEVAQGGGDDEGFPRGFGGVGRLGQHPVAVAVEASRVPVVRHGDARRISGRDRRHYLAVIHGPHGSSIARCGPI